MQQVRFLIRQVARTNASVLITGPSGTGKELAARAIHELSSGRGGPFVAVNCSALPESLVESELFGCERGAYTGADSRRAGCFELADHGTLFLDEIGELPPRAQAKLLRAVEDRRIRRLGGKAEIPVSVRIIASTNINLPEAIEKSRFRQDLFYRLNAFDLKLPPLEDRLEDIPALAESLILRLNIYHEQRVSGITAGAIAALCSRAWPGNVRELKNVLERAVVVAGEGVIGVGHLVTGRARTYSASTPYIQVPVGATIEYAKMALIRFTIDNTANKLIAAKTLGISYKTLTNWVAESNERICVSRPVMLQHQPF